MLLTFLFHFSCCEYLTGRETENYQTRKSTTTLLPWMRPTLFTYLNFTSNEQNNTNQLLSDDDEKSLTKHMMKNGRLKNVEKEHFPKIEAKVFARVCLVC